MRQLLSIGAFLLTAAAPVRAYAANGTVPVCERLIGVWQCVTHMDYSSPMKAARAGYILHGFKNRFRGITTATDRARVLRACRKELSMFKRATIIKPNDGQMRRLQKQIWAQCLIKPHSSTLTKTYYTSTPACSTAATVATCVATNLSIHTSRPSINGLMGYVVSILKGVPLGTPLHPGRQNACLSQISGWVTAINSTRFRGSNVGLKILRKCLNRARVLKGAP